VPHAQPVGQREVGFGAGVAVERLVARLAAEVEAPQRVARALELVDDHRAEPPSSARQSSGLTPQRAAAR
jgi:hypothetical protein